MIYKNTYKVFFNSNKIYIKGIYSELSTLVFEPLYYSECLKQQIDSWLNYCAEYVLCSICTLSHLQEQEIKSIDYPLRVVLPQTEVHETVKITSVFALIGFINIQEICLKGLLERPTFSILFTLEYPNYFWYSTAI